METLDITQYIPIFNVLTRVSSDYEKLQRFYNLFHDTNSDTSAHFDQQRSHPSQKVIDSNPPVF